MSHMSRGRRGACAVDDGVDWPDGELCHEERPLLWLGQPSQELGASDAEGAAAADVARPGRGLPRGAILRAALLASIAVGACGLAAVGLEGAGFSWISAPSRVESKTALTLWCDQPYTPPASWPWQPRLGGENLQVKVLSYNLQWWSLFASRGGLDGSAGKLIASAGLPQPFDLMAFQECQDPWRVLGDAGLSNQYVAVQGSLGLCVAFQTESWLNLASGEALIGEDLPQQHYGKRMAQWLRLQHRQTGKVVFFVNHHGPLAVGSGGICGGRATAHNLLRTITANAAEGDPVVLLGDFNAGAGSETVQELEKSFYRVFTGDVYGGVDNIFSNLPFSQEQRNLGTGGSDHGALAAVLDLAGSALPPAAFPGVPVVTTTPTMAPGTAAQTAVTALR